MDINWVVLDPTRTIVFRRFRGESSLSVAEAWCADRQKTWENLNGPGHFYVCEEGEIDHADVSEGAVPVRELSLDQRYYLGID